MSNYILLFYVDVIIYPGPYPLAVRRHTYIHVE